FEHPMENSSDSNRPDFWTVRYAAGKTPWDFGGVPAALKSFLARSSTRGRILIPGCGSGYELRAFHRSGYDVSGIDFSPAAVDQARRVLGVLAERIILGDFFTHDFGQSCFDLVYERTFLCSMTPSRWPEYVDRVAELLAPGGRLIGVFLYGQRTSSGPPFPLTDADAKLFDIHFQLTRSEAITDSLPLFRDMEKWQEWRKISVGQ
ncbi:MAG TPA: methyltransferase domain-containing protein, partial [Candidatus Binatia bacterium]|nr:methyltransferase domain-containing protein [Candidatus Binatia bacterium]